MAFFYFFINGGGGTVIDETATGGIYANGQADHTLNIHDLGDYTTGGVYIDGTGNGGKVYQEFGSGGVYCDGTVTTRMIFRPVITGGVYCGGTAQHNETYNSPTMDGGVTCNSTIGIVNYEFPSGGAIVGGDHDKYTIYQPTPTGGAECAGEADDHTHDEFPTGRGLRANSSALISKVVNSITVTGGAYCAGTFGTDHNIYPEGGAIVNSSGEEYAIYNPTVTGGVYCNSTVDVYVYREIAVGDGGVYCAGDADVSSGLFPQGGVVVNSSADISIDSAIRGGVYVDGSNTNQCIFNPDPTGGGYLGNTAAVVVVFRPSEVVSGVLCGGSADVFLDFVTFGGVRVNGTASVFAIYQTTITGGAYCAGDASNSRILIIHPSGGVYVGGAADKTSNYTPVLIPGARCNSTARTFAIYYIDPTSGAIVSGESVGREYTETGDGGVTVNSTAGLGDDHVFVVTDCPEEPNALVCAYKNDDQFCSNLYRIQGIGSRLMKPRRLDVTALPLKPFKDRPVYGTSANVPATTFCLEKIRPRVRDQKPTTVFPPTDDDMMFMTMAASEQPQKTEETPKAAKKPEHIVVGSGAKNTPQMAKLKKINEAIKNEPKPVKKPKLPKRTPKPVRSISRPTQDQGSAI